MLGARIGPGCKISSRIENQEALSSQIEDAGDEIGAGFKQILARPLEPIEIDVDHLIHPIDEQAEQTGGGAQHDGRGPKARRALRQTKPKTQVRNGDHLSAEIQKANHQGGGQRNPGHRLMPQ